jgi:hypothetical protein
MTIRRDDVDKRARQGYVLGAIGGEHLSGEVVSDARLGPFLVDSNSGSGGAVSDRPTIVRPRSTLDPPRSDALSSRWTTLPERLPHNIAQEILSPRG